LRENKVESLPDGRLQHCRPHAVSLAGATSDSLRVNSRAVSCEYISGSRCLIRRHVQKSCKKLRKPKGARGKLDLVLVWKKKKLRKKSSRDANLAGQRKRHRGVKLLFYAPVGGMGEMGGGGGGGLQKGERENDGSARRTLPRRPFTFSRDSPLILVPDECPQLRHRSDPRSAARLLASVLSLRYPSAQPNVQSSAIDTWHRFIGTRRFAIKATSRRWLRATTDAIASFRRDRRVVANRRQYVRVST